jgi:putative endonuclease
LQPFVLMAWFVYIIQSENNGEFYKGFTTDVFRRINQHNEGLSTFTSKNRPWKLVYLREFESKKESIREERQLKRQHRQYLEWLIEQPHNRLLQQ